MKTVIKWFLLSLCQQWDAFKELFFIRYCNLFQVYFTAKKDFFFAGLNIVGKISLMANTVFSIVEVSYNLKVFILFIFFFSRNWCHLIWLPFFFHWIFCGCRSSVNELTFHPELFNRLTSTRPLENILVTFRGRKSPASAVLVTWARGLNYISFLLICNDPLLNRMLCGWTALWLVIIVSNLCDGLMVLWHHCCLV